MKLFDGTGPSILGPQSGGSQPVTKAAQATSTSVTRRRRGAIRQAISNTPVASPRQRRNPSEPRAVSKRTSATTRPAQNHPQNAPPTVNSNNLGFSYGIRLNGNPHSNRSGPIGDSHRTPKPHDARTAAR